MSRLRQAFRYLHKRLAEPSTSAALSAILGSFGVQQSNPWLTAASVGFGLAGVFLGEKSR
jgi:hypothetical protein